MSRLKQAIYNMIPDKLYLKLLYKRRIGKALNLKNPQTFNEKLQWLKLYNKKTEYTAMVDKYEVKKYVADKIGREYIIPSLGVWDRFDDIDFDSLPDRFVLKCTHDSGGIVICKNKATFDKNAARALLEKHLAASFYHFGREWPYKNVKPRIIAEQFMEETDGTDLKDYKFFCFNGEPKMILVCAERFAGGGLRENFYDVNWTLMPVQRPKNPNTDYAIDKPLKLSEMLKLSGILAKDIPFARIDFYEINGKIYFGEITFFPASGFENFVPDEWDYTFGSWIQLPEKINQTV